MSSYTSIYFAWSLYTNLDLNFLSSFCFFLSFPVFLLIITSDIASKYFLFYCSLLHNHKDRRSCNNHYRSTSVDSSFGNSSTNLIVWSFTPKLSFKSRFLQLLLPPRVKPIYLQFFWLQSIPRDTERRHTSKCSHELMLLSAMSDHVYPLASNIFADKPLKWEQIS